MIGLQRDGVSPAWAISDQQLASESAAGEELVDALSADREKLSAVAEYHTGKGRDGQEELFWAEGTRSDTHSYLLRCKICLLQRISFLRHSSNSEALDHCQPLACLVLLLTR